MALPLLSPGLTSPLPRSRAHVCKPICAFRVASKTAKKSNQGCTHHQQAFSNAHLQSRLRCCICQSAIPGLGRFLSPGRHSTDACTRDCLAAAYRPGCGGCHTERHIWGMLCCFHLLCCSTTSAQCKGSGSVGLKLHSGYFASYECISSC